MRFEYDKLQFPSAPIVAISVSGAAGTASEGKGRVDTGADITVIPQYMVRELGMVESGVAKIEGVTGHREAVTYEVDISTCGVVFRSVTVVSLPRAEALIGRDLLNLCHVTLDGRNEAFEIAPWSTSTLDLIR